LTKKQLTGALLAALILIVMMFIPGTENLSSAGIKTICMLIAFLIMLITAPFRFFHTGLIFIALMPVLGVAPTLSDALTGISNPVILFVIASFGITAAFTSLPLAKRILVAILRRFGKNVRQITLAIMACAALVSGIVLSVPTCAVFMAIGLSFLELYDDPEDKKRTGRALMIAIPVATMIGAIMTPIASAISLIALSKLEEFTGVTIPFIKWMAVGVPIAVVTLPVAWLTILKVHKPAEVSEDMVKKFISNLGIPEKLTKPEINVLIITGVMMALWIASSWVKSINIMVVAVLGACTYCIPQLKTLKFETFAENIGWDSIFLAVSVFSLGDLMVKNGVSDYLVSILPVLNVSTPVLIAFVALLFFALLIIIPIAPSLVIIMAPPLIALAVSTGTSPALIMFAAAICGCCCFLLPLDTVPLLTYSKGYYTIKDMFVSSLPIQIFIVIVLSVWLTVANGMFL